MISEKRKLTLSVDKYLIESAKRYAQQHNTTVSELVARYFRQLEQPPPPHPQPPILRQLSGILPQVEEPEVYYQHLQEK